MATRRPTRTRTRVGLGTFAALATIISAVFAVLTYCQRDNADESPNVSAAEPSSSNGTSASAPASPSRSPVYLAGVEPYRGLSRLAPLPDQLEGETGYDNSVVIACPTNQTGDEVSEVVYEARYRYETFSAMLRPYRDPEDDVRVELQVFSDPPDRDPGAPPPGEQGRFSLEVGQSEQISVPVSDAYYLRLRVLCEKPEGYVVLANAAVVGQ